MLSTNCIGAALTAAPKFRNNILIAQFENNYLCEFLTVPASWPLEFHKQVYVHIYCHQDAQVGAQTWYGFASAPELALFRQLINVDKVGPKGALTMLTKVGFKRFQKFIENNDAQGFIECKGVGPKTGEQVVKALFTQAPVKSKPVDKNVVMAMQALGYSATAAKEATLLAMQDLPNGTTEELLKAALKLCQKSVN